LLLSQDVLWAHRALSSPAAVSVLLQRLHAASVARADALPRATAVSLAAAVRARTVDAAACLDALLLLGAAADGVRSGLKARESEAGDERTGEVHFFFFADAGLPSLLSSRYADCLNAHAAGA
jgi:hypothetical protein